MKSFSLFRWFRNISIVRKLYFAVGAMAVLIALELFTLLFSINTLSSVRASVVAEGLWSKAQKDAILELYKYSRSCNEDDYANFLSFLNVPFGDRKAFAEIAKENPDVNIVRQGYLEGGVNPDNVDGVVKLFIRFKSISYIQKAIIIFNKGDSLISDLQNSAAQLHSVILASGLSSSQQIEKNLNDLNELNVNFTTMENEFSATLEQGSHWLQGLILKLLFAIALTVVILGLMLTISVSRGISKGISEIIRASEQVARGNFKDKAVIYSNDEIGQLASSFNIMMEEVAYINKELEQFAYVASHDLQEPLRTISNFTGLLKEQNSLSTDEDTQRYIGHILSATSKMQQLIKDLMNFSRIGRNIQFATVNTNDILKEVVAQMYGSFWESDAKISAAYLPVLRGNEMELKQLFQNLISNAIKFRKKNTHPEIKITFEEKETEYLFAFKDNGIGIDEQYNDRIFIIFQRLHTTTQYPGTGIGLATCKKIVALHNGKLWVESKLGEGSTFYFTIAKKL